MSNKDDTSPATKADLEKLRKEFQVDRESLRDFMRSEAEETRRHFGVVAEQLLHEFRGAFGDRTSQHTDRLVDHEHRLQTVERKVGLVF